MVCPTGAKISQVKPFWFFCRTALVPRQDRFKSGKIAPGLVAMLPGSTLFVHLDDPFQAMSAGEPPALEANVALSYLTSYQHMGVVDLRCEASCACLPQQIDAHHIGDRSERNESVSKTRGFSVRPVSALAPHVAPGCVLRLTVLKSTSSRGHKFKVLSLIVWHRRHRRL